MLPVHLSVALSKPPLPKSREIATALYDYESENPDDLCFSTGDVLIILEKSESGWWTGELNGKKGFVPATYF